MKKFWKNTGFQLLFVLITIVTGWCLYRRSSLAEKFPILNFDIPKIENRKEDGVLSPFKDKEFQLSYSSRPILNVRELSEFEDDENWQGDGEFDYLDYYEGKSSLLLASQNGIGSEALFELKEKIKLVDYKYLKFFLKINSDASKIRELRLILDDGKSIPVFKYSVKKFSKGWNLLTIPVNHYLETDNFTDLEKVTFELISQPSTIASVNIDYLWLEKDDNYLEDWVTRNENFFFLKKYDNSLYLSTANILGNLAVLKPITSANNYIFSVKFIPLREGFFGLFLRGNLDNGYGYYFIVDGPGSNNWKILKEGDFVASSAKTLKEGKFTGYSLKKNLPYWLKVNMKDDHLIFSISPDGKKYVTVGEVYDKTYGFGKVGIVSGNLFLLINDIYFLQ